MKLPRDIGGDELAVILSIFGYQVTRQTGSHMRLTTNYMGMEQHITIPKHKPLRAGTLSSIINEVAGYLEIDRQSLIDKLFG
jgi:predicted RNA binding protein YcfA (HicA-like mRNA interferase family)